MRHAWTALLGLAVLTTGACGEIAHAHLRVQLRALPTEDPFAGVEVLRVSIRRDEEVLATTETALAGGRVLEMPAIDRLEGIVIEILGLPEEGSQVPVSRGEIAPKLPARGRSCCVRVCFCQEEAHQAQRCGCGVQQCTAECAP